MALSINTPIRVLFQSKEFLVIEKPFDLVINHDDPERLSLAKLMCHQHPHLADMENYKFGFRILHRLDYSTSGIMAFPLTAEAMKTASKAFQQRKTIKYYLAILRGHVAQDHLHIQWRIGEHRDPDLRKTKMCSEKNPQDLMHPKPASTKLIVLSRGVYEGKPATKVILKPLTGRRHQLRLHCHDLGHTIIGDYTYSNKLDTTPYRMFLHAHVLIIPRPSLNIVSQDPFFSEADFALHGILSSSCPPYIAENVIHDLDDDLYSLFDKLSENDWESPRN